MTVTAPARPTAATTPASCDELVRDHVPFVAHIVRDVLAKVPAHVNRDDLMSAGLLALTLAAQSFDPSRGVPFTSFAGIRIRGALTDELRSMDWASRAVRSRAREIEAARDGLTCALGRTPSRSELAAQLQITEQEIDAHERDVHRAELLSVETLTPARESQLPIADGSPEGALVERETLEQLRTAITALPERLRIVVEGYFFEQRRTSDIAAELGVTESRISQLRSEALELLRAGLHATDAGAFSAPPEPTSTRRAKARAAYCAAVTQRVAS